jgi:hypothetical protein
MLNRVNYTIDLSQKTILITGKIKKLKVNIASSSVNEIIQVLVMALVKRQR